MAVKTMARRTLLATLPAGLLAGRAVARRRDQDYVVDRYGARGDGKVDDTAAIQRAVDACARAGGGIVRLLAGGRYLSGTVILKDRVTLDIAAGATLLATTDRKAYRAEGSLLFAEGATDVAVSGRGTIDGQGSTAAWFPTLVEGQYTVPAPFLGRWNPLEPEAARGDGRPRMILLIGCRRVALTDFRIHDAPTWTIHPVGCEDVLIDGVTIDNGLLVPNCDGIDIDRCRRVRIANCAIRAGDDCIVLKTSRNFTTYGDCEEITVTNCTLESSSAGIKLEPEGPGRISGVTIAGCTISRSNRGVAVLQRDGATVEDVLFSDLAITTRRHHPMWWGAAEAIHISNLPRRAGTPAGVVRAIRFDNLTCRGEGGLFVRGWPGSVTSDISFAGVDLTIAKTTAYAAGTYDLRPTEVTPGVYKSRIAAVLAYDVSNLTLSDVAVHWSGAVPSYFGAALDARRVDGLTLDRFTGSAASPTGQATELVDVRSRPVLR